MSAAEFPQDPEAQHAYIHKARLDVIQKLAMASAKVMAVPDDATEPGKSLHPRLNALLSDLHEKVNMTPELWRATKIDEGLQLVYNRPNFYFAKHQKEKAKALYEKWQALNWGGAPPALLAESISSTAESDDDTDTKSSAKRRRTSAVPVGSDRAVIKRPPPDHPIWGVDGIMHGLALKTNLDSGRKSKVLNDDYDKRGAKVFGHNHNQPGAWYPSQLSALFHGAHGSSQGGITGDPSLGAYSIVVSGMYEDLDRDRGETLYYSGSGSHDNTDPGRAAESTSGTRSLTASMNNGRPVRVLRASGGKSRYAPYKGIRYDGLYRVVQKRYPKNGKGGLYEQFELEREEGQRSLDACKSRPNPKDLGDFDRIENGYSSRR